MDVVLAEKTDGKPIFIIDDGRVHSTTALLSAAIAEVKSPSEPLVGEVTSFAQPVMELAAMAASCQFEKREIPLILIYVSRLRYRPLLYFKHDDMLTTSNTIAYADTAGNVCLQGLFLLFILCQKNIVDFKIDQIKASFSKSGWQEALQPNPYEGIHLTRERKHTTVENLNPPLLATKQEYASHLLKKRRQGSDDSSNSKRVT